MLNARSRTACLLVFAAASALRAQGRGATPLSAGSGTVEHVIVHGRSLERNLEGDSPDRQVTIYLPPSYARDQARRFPVVYLLHGYGLRDDTFTTRLANLAESADRLAATPGFSESIVVTPDAYTLHRGSLYSSSPTIGDWERFVAEDLVAFVDGKYRTIATRMSRGLAGHSMGGYGALRIAMKRPDVFSAVYAMSACCLAVNRNPRGDTMAAAEAVKTREQAEEAARGSDVALSVALASAAAWSSNPAGAPLFLDLPMANGQVRAAVLDKWAANAPLEMVRQHAPDLQKLYALAVDIGVSDTLLPANRQLHEVMTALRIPHSYEEYDGDHTNRVRERIGRNVLVFFSRNLAAPANPTSPSPQP
jgi:enterochelin esterase-like enzyme